MRNLLFPPVLSLILSAQAPVDYPALKQAVEAAVAAAKADIEAQVKAGTPKDQIRANLDKPLQAIRAQGARASGEGQHACLLAELNVTIRFSMPEALLSRVFTEVPAESPAWQVVEPQLIGFLPMALGPTGEAYARKMGENGLPELRPIVLSGLVEAQLEAGKLEEARALVSTLKNTYPGNTRVTEVSAHLANELAIAVGQQAPDFALTSLDDPKVTFTKASFKGKYLLLDFWGTWCGWCVKELPTTHKVYAAYHGKGLEILSLAADKNPEAVVEFRQRPGTPMPWKHAFIGRGEASDPVVEAYRIQGFPSLFLIGPDGTIAARGEDLREEKLVQTLSRFLK